MNNKSMLAIHISTIVNAHESTPLVPNQAQVYGHSADLCLTLWLEVE